MVLVQQTLNFHFLSAYAVGFIPVHFGIAYPPTLEADFGNAFELTPPSGTILFLVSHNIPDSTTDGQSLNIFDFANYFEVHSKVYQLV